MSTEQTPESPQWGAPPPPTPPTTRWTTRRIVAAVAIAVGIAAAGGVAIYAASGSVNAEDGGPQGRQGGPMIVGPMGGMEGLAHGEFQSGEVTELTDDSITAKSDDGYTKTYVIDDETMLGEGLEKGDDVMIVASVDGSTATAESVIEPGDRQRMPKQGGPMNGGPPNN